MRIPSLFSTRATSQKLREAIAEQIKTRPSKSGSSDIKASGRMFPRLPKFLTFAPVDPRRSIYRTATFEQMEPRTMFNADPIWVGGVYVEEDGGSDLHGDSFYISFNGGAANTTLNKVIIDTDQGIAGLSQGDNFFDLTAGGLGADGSFPFKVISLQTADPNARVTAIVQDGGMKLELTFVNFRAGDKLKFSVDVDESQHLDPGVTDFDEINDGVDPITSGVEFQGSKFQAFFSANNYEDIVANSIYKNAYDTLLVGSNLDLPADNDGGFRDRTAGTGVSVVQVPKPISIEGTVYVDNNLNLIQDNGELPLQNVALELFRQEGANYVSTGHTATTNAQGHYVFGLDLKLPPGTYQIRETQPTGYFSVGAVPGRLDNGTPTGQIVVGNKDILTQIDVLLGDTHATNLDFAEAQPTRISGYVYEDLNDDGLRASTGEKGIANVTIRLESISTIANAVTLTTQTDANGYYSFSALPPGTYRITEVNQPAGYFDGKDTAGTVAGQRRGTVTINEVIGSISLNGNDIGIEYNFGELPPGSLSGHVCLANPGFTCADTGPEAKSPLAGVTVELINSAGTVVDTQITDIDGYYKFGNLTIGTYTIREITPVGVLDGSAEVGRINGQTIGQILGGSTLTTIALAAGQNGVDYDFCELPPGSLAGFVKLVNPGFDCDSTEPGAFVPLVGVTIELIDSSGTVIATQLTDSQGAYKFENLPIGNYTIRETTPQGVIDGDAHVGQINGQTIGQTLGTSTITTIALAAGLNGIHYDFCEFPPAIISGHVFEDIANDGIRQSSDPLIAGVQVDLFDATGALLQSVITDTNGYYEFVGLAPGDYRLVESQPNNYIDGKDVVGTIQGQPVGIVNSATDTISAIALPFGRSGLNYDFGELRAASLAGTVFTDLDNDCVQDIGEAPISNVRIVLFDGQGNIAGETFTDANGNYTFTNLTPGQYTVVETQPDGYFQGGQTAPTGRANTSKQDELSAITLASGELLNDLDFCEIPPAAISGYVFQDGPAIVTESGLAPLELRPIRNGARDSSDAPIGNVTLELRTVSGLPFPADRALPGIYTGDTIRVTTDANGFFEFTGLRPGTYHVYEVQPEDYIDGLDTPGTTGGLSVNREDLANNPQAASLLTLLAADSTTNPRNDAILLVQIAAGQTSRENNFSEILVTKAPPPPPPPSPPLPPPPLTPPPPPGPPPIETPPFYNPTLIALPPAVPLALPFAWTLVGGGAPEYTWHLSVINAGTPRGKDATLLVNKSQIADIATMLDVYHWRVASMQDAQWQFVSSDVSKTRLVAKNAFDVPNSIALAGDFNGDGVDELALFLEGEWLIDVNGNGRWDDGDMWAKLGSEGDLPVIGDWDGDGKDDIGVFGPQWDGDDVMIANETGLPDSENRQTSPPKNLPPENEVAEKQRRLLQRSTTTDARSDVIDHVFRQGVRDDVPVAGDFNGDGISTVGIYRNGKWRLDTNGDGKWNKATDSEFEFGAAGEVPVVGDFDGDGVDDIAVIRHGKLIIDSNHNGREDATDRVFELESETGQYVIGDFDGDGFDQAALHRDRASAASAKIANEKSNLQQR